MPVNACVVHTNMSRYVPFKDFFFFRFHLLSNLVTYNNPRSVAIKTIDRITKNYPVIPFSLIKVCWRLSNKTEEMSKYTLCIEDHTIISSPSLTFNTVW